jgi:hypothetical protein
VDAAVLFMWLLMHLGMQNSMSHDLYSRQP